MCHLSLPTNSNSSSCFLTSTEFYSLPNRLNRPNSRVAASQFEKYKKLILKNNKEECILSYICIFFGKNLNKKDSSI